jgi:hypothetical protein
VVLFSALSEEPARDRTVRGALRSGAELPPQQLTRDAERTTSRRRSFLGLLPRVFASLAHPLGLSARAKRARTPRPNDRLVRRYGCRLPSQNLLLSIATPRHGVSAEHGRRRHRGGRRAPSVRPSRPTGRWNQMEPNGTVYDDFTLLFCEQTYRNRHPPGEGPAAGRVPQVGSSCRHK